MYTGLRRKSGLESESKIVNKQQSEANLSSVRSVDLMHLLLLGTQKIESRSS